jgi:hypothetical protein
VGELGVSLKHDFMSEFNPLQQKIVDAMTSKGVTDECPFCHHKEWAVIGEVISVQIASFDGSVRLPAPFIPSAGLVCSHCGYIRLHTLPALNIKISDLEKGGG